MQNTPLSPTPFSDRTVKFVDSFAVQFIFLHSFLSAFFNYFLLPNPMPGRLTDLSSTFQSNGLHLFAVFHNLTISWVVLYLFLVKSTFRFIQKLREFPGWDLDESVSYWRYTICSFYSVFLFIFLELCFIKKL